MALAVLFNNKAVVFMMVFWTESQSNFGLFLLKFRKSDLHTFLHQLYQIRKHPLQFECHQRVSSGTTPYLDLGSI